MRQLLFISVYLLVYGGMHLYLFRKVTAAFSLPLPVRLGLATALLILMLLPMAHHWLEAAGQQALGMAVNYLAFYWMGFAFLLFSLLLVLDLGHLLAFLGERLVSITLPLPGRALGVSLATGLALCLMVYGYYEAHTLRVDRVSIHSSKVPPGTAPLRLVQISDLHLGPMYSSERLAALIATVEALKPDILVATGDIVDGQAEHINGYTEPLKALHAPLGKFAVTGNHEFYVGLQQSLAVLELAGFRVLRQEVVSPLPWLELVGVDDPSGARMGVPVGTPEPALLDKLNDRDFVVLLKHPPRISDAARAHVDLQLSGHIHGGQIAPFGLLTWLVYRQITGLTALNDRLMLYVSRGTGTWGPPIRIMAPPEVTLFEIMPE